MVDAARLLGRDWDFRLVDVKVPGGTVTENGLRMNVSVGIQYIESWMRGTGAAAINNLMEDVATAEISRSQIWQWVKHSSRLEEGPTVNADLASLLSQFPQAVPGPDAWPYFEAHQSLIGSDCVDPTPDAGAAAYRKLYVDAVLVSVYGKVG